MRQHVARPIPQNTKNNAVERRLARAGQIRDFGDEFEHRADRAFSLRGMARKRMLRRFPRTDLYA
jgi:hypothetical protein